MTIRVPAQPLRVASPEHHQPRTLREAYAELHLRESGMPWRGDSGAGVDLRNAVASSAGQASVMTMTRVFGS